jgi:hypothetical protein
MAHKMFGNFIAPVGPVVKIAIRYRKCGDILKPNAGKRNLIFLRAVATLPRNHITTLMKTLALCALTMVGIALSAFAADAPAMKEKLRHFVAFKFKDTATPEQIKEVEDAFRALKGKIPQIVALESGANNSAEHFNKGLTHGFLVTFNSEKDRDAYLVHPEHQNFGKLLRPVMEDVFVFDFWGKN